MTLGRSADFAEQYAHSDPQSAVTKLRNFAERMVKALNGQLGIEPAPRAVLDEQLRHPDFEATIPQPVRLKLGALRDHGNKAAHGEKITQPTAKWLLREAFDLACWYYLFGVGGEQADCPEFTEPPEGGAAADSRLPS